LPASPYTHTAPTLTCPEKQHNSEKDKYSPKGSLKWKKTNKKGAFKNQTNAL
jgi:hypothetical protein